MSDQTTYSLAEIRNGTGWPEGVRFAVVNETPPGAVLYRVEAAFCVDRWLTHAELDELALSIHVQLDDPANAEGDRAAWSAAWVDGVNITGQLAPTTEHP